MAQCCLHSTSDFWARPLNQARRVYHVGVHESLTGSRNRHLMPGPLDRSNSLFLSFTRFVPHPAGIRPQYQEQS